LLIFTFAGLIAHIILYVAGIMGISSFHYFLTAQHPDAPVAVPIHWLRTHFHTHRRFHLHCDLGIIVSILTYTTIVYDYLRRHPKSSDETSVSDKSDVG